MAGKGTGVEIEMNIIRLFREILCDYPLIIDADMTLETCEEQFPAANAGIVVSWFKMNSFAICLVDTERVTEFMNAIKGGYGNDAEP